MNQSSTTAISQTPQPAGQKPAAEETAKASAAFNPWFPFAAIPAFKEVQTHWMNPYTGVIRDAWNYTVDAMQRTVLFWEVLRQRSEQYYQHKAMPVPHVLSFEAELMVDARTLERPTNYLLMRIVPPAGKTIDAQKRPFLVVDPRAGHGPGIAGFKPDSELGVALEAGHPCYFIGFTPDPMPDQTIEDILHAQALFLEKVIDFHPEAEGKPCVIGNCQAGWAVMMLAAVRPELFGPIIAAGAPLSYWAGARGVNPMRYSGGLLGGSWLTAFTNDVGNGKFDGSWLVTNFENLNPAHALWAKPYKVWSEVDSEAPRYLGFEKWWGGHVNLNAAEIQWIVDQLFVGNRLATAEITTSEGVRIDLRNIRSPIICFCSKGDNITPPPQALGWITDLYQKDDDILAHGQTIVYALHDSIGHLGIFVSGGVARKEHQEFTSNIDLIDVLPPGLYEAVLVSKTADTVNPELVMGDWIVRFERRTLSDIQTIVATDPEDERRFAAARRLSDVNLGLYRSFVQPFVRGASNDYSAEWLRRVQPSELPYELFSDRNPLMRPLAQLAHHVREQRRPVSAENPFIKLQEQVSQQIITALDAWRDIRDTSGEQMFLSFYGSPVLQALLGLKAADDIPRRRPGLEPEEIAFMQGQIETLKTHFGEGGLWEATIRSFIYIGLAGPGPDERAFAMLRQTRAEDGGLPLQQFKELVREQYLMLLLDEAQALSAIPRMLPDDTAARDQALDTVRRIISAIGAPTGQRAERFEQIERLFHTSASSVHEVVEFNRGEDPEQKAG